MNHSLTEIINLNIFSCRISLIFVNALFQKSHLYQPRKYKSMKKLLLFAAMFSVLTLRAQLSVYHPFPESNASWNISYTQNMCPFGGNSTEYYSITYSGDTIINGQQYHKLHTPFVIAEFTGGCTQHHFAGYAGAIRQDIPNRKVFIVPPSATDEQLLYDFTMEVGDTLKGYLGREWMSQGDVVMEIDSVLVGDTYRKRWSVNPCYNMYLIEGLGSTYGLLEASPGCITDFPWILVDCFMEEGQTLYPETVSECELITSIREKEVVSSKIHVFPNPASGTFAVEFERPMEIKEIQLTNMMGEVIFWKNTQMHARIEVSGIENGIYVLSVISHKGRIINRKVISCSF